MRAASRLGSFGVLGTLGAILCLGLAARGRRVAALRFALAVGVAGVLSAVLALAFDRPSPTLFSHPVTASSSFPSSNAMVSAAAAATLAILTWRTSWRWPVLLLGGAFVALVGTARVYLGLDYPTDVLGGWAAAAAWIATVELQPWSGGRPIDANSENFE